MDPQALQWGCIQISCPPWQPGPAPVVTPPHADSRTHAGRKPSCTQAAGRAREPQGGPRAGWEGGSPCRQDMSGKRGKCLEQERPVGPQPALLPQPPMVPRGRWQAWASAFHWSGLWTSEGKGQRKGPSSSLKTQGGWCQESGASGAGGRIG